MTATMIPADTASVERDFRQAMRRLAATVTVVSIAADGRRHAMTATAVTSVSLAPPALLVCVNQAAAMHDLMRDGPAFCVNLLFGDHQAVAAACAGQVPGGDRFAGAAWEERHGLPVLRDAQASLFCRRTAAFPYGSHVVFFGEVFAVAIRDEVAPLLYQDGRYAIGRPLAETATA